MAVMPFAKAVMMGVYTDAYTDRTHMHADAIGGSGPDHGWRDGNQTGNQNSFHKGFHLQTFPINPVRPRKRALRTFVPKGTD
jgi:hypothetical protein